MTGPPVLQRTLILIDQCLECGYGHTTRVVFPDLEQPAGFMAEVAAETLTVESAAHDCATIWRQERQPWDNQ